MKNPLIYRLPYIRTDYISFLVLHLLVIQTTIFAISATLTGCTSGSTSKSTDSEQILKTQSGLAAFVGEEFQGKQTAGGKSFDKNQLVAAHPSYPIGTIVRVTNLENARAVNVRVIDRGPSTTNQQKGVIIDLSHSAAEKLGFVKDGSARVRTEVLEWGGEHHD